MNARSSTAIHELEEAIYDDRKLPEYVFRKYWAYSLFFDSDLMFNAQFIDTIQALLTAEGGTCACIAELGSKPIADRSIFCIDAQTSGEDYGAVISRVPNGLLY